MKRVLSAFLALALIFCMVPKPIHAAAATPPDSTVADKWDGKAASAFASGNGSQTTPYVIKTAEQLAYLAQAVNNSKFGSSFVMLANNIDLSGYSWTPIGKSSSCAFAGVFEGNGYTISGLQITSSSNGIAGLFGYNNGTIRNFNITISNFSVSYGSGDSYVGAVAACSTEIGFISDVAVSGNITAKNASSTTAHVYCAGIAGDNSSNIQRCSFSGNITVSSHGGYYVGGIVGNNSSYVIDSAYSTGIITASKSAATTDSNIVSVGCFAGGIAATNDSTIKNCYSTMNVTANALYERGKAFAGGLIGSVGYNGATLTNSYAHGAVTANTNNGQLAIAGGLIGSAKGSIVNCYAINDVKADTGYQAVSYAGRLYGDGSCTVTNSYYSASTSVYRIKDHTWTETIDDGCGKSHEETYHEFQSTNSPSNSGYTGTFTYSQSFITNTLKWGTYVNVSNAVSSPNNTWVVGTDRPHLHTEYIHSLTINYHRNDVVDHILFQWMDNNAPYAFDTPELAGHTPNKTAVSGTITQDTIIDVNYTPNIYNVTLEYRTSDGKLLGSDNYPLAYGTEYDFPVPYKPGYTAQQSNVTGVVGAEDITIPIIYDINTYTLTINYVYTNSGDAAAETKQLQLKYGETYSVDSPYVPGYTASQNTVSGMMPATDQTVTIYYGTQTYRISIIHQYENGQVISIDNHALSYGQSFAFNALALEGYTSSQTVVSGTVQGSATYTITYTPSLYTLTIQYTDIKTGAQVASPYVQTYNYGQTYSISSPTIDGAVASKAVVTGQMPAHDVTESVVYGKNMYPVYITYQYSDGTLIRGETVNVEYGTDYAIASPEVKWHSPDKAYVTGTMPAQAVTVTVTYTRNIVASGNCGVNVNWAFYEDGMLEISGQGEMQPYSGSDKPWQEWTDKIQQISVSDGVTAIGAWAFADLVAVKSVSIPDSVTKIGAQAFIGCTSLMSVHIPKNVSTIGNGVFVDCYNLISLTVDTDNPWFVMEEGVLFNTAKNTLVLYPSNLYADSYDVPSGVTTIAPYAFYGNAYIQSITFPDTLTRIGENAFGFSAISKLHITSANIAVEKYAFLNSSLEKLIIDGKITELGDYAFASSQIRSVYFKSDVPGNVGIHIFGNNATTMEQLCLYYPLDNESWLSAITVSSDANGYKREYWQGYHAYAYNGVGDVTLENAGNRQVYATFVYCDKTPVAHVFITFNGVTKKTDEDGFAYFTYADITQTDLKIHKDHYVSSYEVSSAYSLKSIGVDYFNLTTNSDVSGLTCYGNDITTDIAYINVKYEGSIPILVKGNSEFNITKMELFQEVRDSKNPSNGFIKKTLQTIKEGDENLTSDGYCRFLVEASAFSFSIDEDYPIYVRMYTDSGEDAVEKQLRIHTISFKFTADFSKLLDDISLNLGDTGVPFLDGMKLNVKTPLECPLSFKVVNNEVYITWGLDDLLDEELSHIKTEVEGTTSNLKKDIENTNTRINKYMTKLSYQADEKLNKGKLLKTKHTPSFSLETDMAGGICFTVGEQNDLQSIRSYLKLSVEMKASWTADYLFLMFIPITIEVKANASGEIEVQGLGYDIQNSKVLLPEVTFTSEISLQMSLGLGCRVVSAGLFGRLKVSASIVIGEVTYFDGLVLNGEWGIYAKLDLGVFTLYEEKAWKFWEVELIPKSASMELFSTPDDTGYMGQYKGLAVYDLSSYAAQTEPINMEDVKWAVDFSDNIELNTYTYAKPQLVTYNDTSIMAYLTVCADRASLNSQALVYRVYDESTNLWSEPIFVDDNGTSDSNFALAEYNGTLYVVYTEADKVFTEADTTGKTDQQMMIDSSLAQEVVVAAYDPQSKQFETVKTLTNDNYFDATPVIRAIDGKLYVAWTTNYATDESLVFGMNSENEVKLCCFDGKTWTSPECIISGCNPVAEMALAELDGKAHLAMIIDEDANYYTSDDNNIYIADTEGNITFIDCYGEAIGNLQSAHHQEETMLTWYCNGGLKKLSSVTAEPQFLVEQSAGITQDYKLVSLADNILALTWCVKGIKKTEQSSEQSEISIKILDDSGEWTQTKTACQAPDYMMNYALDVYNGDLRFVYTQTKMTSGQNDNLTMNSKLCSYFLTMGYDLEVGECTNMSIDNSTRTLSLDVEFTNNGIKNIKQISVVLEEKDTATGLIDEYHAIGLFPVELLSGETETVHLELVIPVHASADAFDGSKFTIKPFDGTEADFLAYVDKLNEATESGFHVMGSVSGSVSGSLNGDSYIEGSDFIRPGIGYPGGSGGTLYPGGGTAMAVDPDLKIEGEYIIIGETEYLSLKVTNIGQDTAYGMLNVVKQSADGNTDPVSVYTANITDLAPGGIKFYLVELKKDFFESTHETFECWLSHCKSSDNESNNRISITANKMENAAGTERDDNAVASELSSYNEVFDKYTSEDLEVSITLNGNEFKGLRDIVANENAVYFANEDETVLYLTIDKEYLRTLDVGFHEQVFLFLTECGYVDCVLNLTIEDSTPIDLTGGISIIGSPQRGEQLSVDISGLNTEEVTYSWALDGEEVSTEAEYIITNQDLGKWLSVTVSGTGLYRGSFSTGVYINKISRSINAPKVNALGSDDTVQVKKGFIVGDGTVEYGWATENDPDKVTQWSTDSTVTFQWDDLYYLFVRVTGSEIYQDAVSEAAVYTNKDVDVQISKVNLRSNCAGLYFTGSFDIKEGIQVARKGIAVSLYNKQPTADGSDPTSKWTEGNTSVVVANILGEGNTDAENARRAAMPIYARAYVELADGTYVYSDTVCVNLQTMVEAVDTMWGKLTEAQQESFRAMYDKFKQTIDLWKVPNLKSQSAT